MRAQLRTIKDQLDENETRFDCIVNAAGGFEMQGIQSEEIFESMERLYHKNCLTSILCGHLGAHYLNPNSLLVLIGSKTVFDSSNPQILSYSTSKSFVHGLALNLSKDKNF